MDIVIQTDGSVRVTRGTFKENQLIIDVFGDIINDTARSELFNFFKSIDKKEQIFGESGLCG